MKVLIIDDITSVREGLKALLEKYCPQVDHIFESDGVASGIKSIYENKPDLVFTDVEMEDGTGMDLLSKLPEINFQIIFITAHNKYAIDAFKFSAIDFLLKPIDADELTKSVHAAYKNMEHKKLFNELLTFKENQSLTKTDKKLVLKELDSISVIRVSDIIFCQAEGVYTKFNLADGSHITVSKNLKEYEDLLEPYDFLRVHNSFLINIDKIEKFDKSAGGFVILKGNHSISVSQRKKELLIELFKRL